MSRGAIQEQADRLTVREGLLTTRQPACGRNGQGWHAINLLTGNAQRLAAGCEQMNLTAAPQNGIRERHHGVDHMLAIVQDDEQLPRPQCIHEGVQNRPIRRFLYADSGGDRGRDQAGIVQGGQLGQPDPVT